MASLANPLGFMSHHCGQRVRLLAPSQLVFPAPSRICWFLLWSAVSLMERMKAHLACLTPGTDRFSHSYPLSDEIIFSKSHVISSHYFFEFFLRFVNNEGLKNKVLKILLKVNKLFHIWIEICAYQAKWLHLAVCHFTVSNFKYK